MYTVCIYTYHAGACVYLCVYVFVHVTDIFIYIHICIIHISFYRLIIYMQVHQCTHKHTHTQSRTRTHKHTHVLYITFRNTTSITTALPRELPPLLLSLPCFCLHYRVSAWNVLNTKQWMKRSRFLCFFSVCSSHIPLCSDSKLWRLSQRSWVGRDS